MKFSWPKYEIIKEVNGEQVLYLRRYFIFRSKLINIFLHYIAMPDQDKTKQGNEASHNHPWDFFGVVLNGGYEESLYSAWNVKKVINRGRFSWAYRKAKDYHKITAVKPNCYTLIFTGPVINEWSFWTEDNIVVPWREFLGVGDKEIDMD